MNTRFSLVLPAVEADAGVRLAGEVQALLRDQELLMSRFTAAGDLATLNRDAGCGPAHVPDRLWEVLGACQRHHRLTEGAFDIAQGAPMHGHGMHNVAFDAAARTVQFGIPGMQLDLGGIGKGIALDLVRQHLRERDVSPAFLSFGESSLAVIGAHPFGNCWTVGVEHLFEPGDSVHQFDLHDAAMSTSGNRPGQAHIINPADGQLVTGCKTVSVSCASAADAEALSTALFVLPSTRRSQVLRNYRGAQAVEVAYLEQNGKWSVEKRWQHD